jgi:hypothetical protein
MGVEGVVRYDEDFETSLRRGVCVGGLVYDWCCKNLFSVPVL